MILIRDKNNREDYYSISVYKTLFDDFLIEHHSGMTCNSKKIHKHYFEEKKEALYHSLSLMLTKKKQGFSKR